MKFNMYFYIIKEEEERIRKKIRELQGGEQKEMTGGEKETYPYNLFKKSIDFIINIKNKNKDERTEVFKKLFAQRQREQTTEMELKEQSKNMENKEQKEILQELDVKNDEVKEIELGEQLNKMDYGELNEVDAKKLKEEIEKIEIEQGLKILKEIKRMK